MRYSIRSDMMAELGGKSPGLFRRAASWLLLPLCYFGAFISPAMILAIPFQVFHAHHFSPAIFWFVMLLIGALFLWLFYRTLNSWLRFFRQRVIYVEAGVFLTGLVFAVAVVAWIFPPI
jgi:hypothetical protein